LDKNNIRSFLTYEKCVGSDLFKLIIRLEVDNVVFSYNLFWHEIFLK